MPGSTCLQIYDFRLFADGDEDRSFRIGTLAVEGTVTIPCRARGGFVLASE